VKVTNERFLKMLGTSDLKLFYYEETQSVEFQFLTEETIEYQSVEGLAKLNRIANKQNYKSFMDLEDFIHKKLKL
jgi:hypothetical protein